MENLRLHKAMTFDSIAFFTIAMEMAYNTLSILSNPGALFVSAIRKSANRYGVPETVVFSRNTDNLNPILSPN